MVKQVERLCLETHGKSLSELDRLTEVKVHGINVVASIAWIPANVSVRCVEESGRVVIVVNPADRTGGCGC